MPLHGNINSWIFQNNSPAIFGGGDPYGPELHTDANAISDPNGNETDATTGWTPSGLTGTGANVFESQAIEVDTGIYAFRTDANDTPAANCIIYADFTTEIGAAYLITFRWRHIGTGGLWRLRVDSVIYYDVQVESTDITWRDGSKEFIATGTTTRVYFTERSGSNNGGVYLDNFSFKKKL